MATFLLGFGCGAITMFTGLALYACCKVSSWADREDEHRWNL